MEILILTVLFCQILPRVRIELWHSAFSSLKREAEFIESNNHRVSLWGFGLGTKHSFSTRPAVNGVVPTDACSLRGREGKNQVHYKVLEGPKFSFCSVTHWLSALKKGINVHFSIHSYDGFL